MEWTGKRHWLRSIEIIYFLSNIITILLGNGSDFMAWRKYKIVEQFYGDIKTFKCQKLFFMPYKSIHSDVLPAWHMFVVLTSMLSGLGRHINVYVAGVEESQDLGTIFGDFWDIYSSIVTSIAIKKLRQWLNRFGEAK